MQVWLAVAWVLVPLACWSPRVLDDARWDGAWLSFLALGLVFVQPKKDFQWLPGCKWILAGLCFGSLGLIGLDWPLWIGGLADRAPLVAVFVGVSALAASPSAFQRALPLIWGGLTLVACISLAQVLGWDPLHLKPLPTSPGTAPLAGRNHAAEFWAVACIGVLAWQKKSVHPLAWALAIPAAFLLGHFGVLASRISMAVGLFLVLRKNSATLVLVACTLLAFLGGEWHRNASQPAWNILEEGEAGEAPLSTMKGRALLYQAGLTHFFQNPRGIGLGRFERDYPHWRPAEEARLSHGDWKNSATRRPKTPHNEWLLFGLETGWLGFLCITMGLIQIGRSARRSWAAPALIVLFLHSLVRSPLSDNGVTLALGAFLWAAACASRPGNSPAKPSETKPPRPGRKTFALTLCVLACIPAPSQILGEWYVSRRLPLDVTKESTIMADAIAWRPWDSRARGILAADLAREESTTATLRAMLTQAIRFDSTDLFALTALFKLEMVAGNEPRGLEWLAAAEALLPDHPVVRGNRTLWIFDQAERHRKAGLKGLGLGQADASSRLTTSFLLRAWGEIRRKNEVACRAELRAAARQTKTLRARIERLARVENLDEEMLQTILRRYGY